MKENTNGKEPNHSKQSLTSLLKKKGFTLPTNEKEVEEYDQLFIKTDIILPAEVDSPDFLFEENQDDKPQASTNNLKSKGIVKEKTKGKVVQIHKSSNVDYYRRTILAAEIVYELHGEMTLGHLKLQKLIFLAQKTEQIDLPLNFLKQAMGPYDPQLMRSIDKQLLAKHWFQFSPNEKLKYKPLKKVGEHRNDFQKYFGNLSDKISWLIETFRKVKSSRVEVIATLYGCWEELIKENTSVNDDALLDKFFAWSQHKQIFQKEEVLQELRWMENNSLYPHKDLIG
jgi:hypothetical protein